VKRERGRKWISEICRGGRSGCGKSTAGGGERFIRELDPKRNGARVDRGGGGDRGGRSSGGQMGAR